MALSYDKSSAVVVFPALALTQISEPRLRSWLERGTVSRLDNPESRLASVLGCLNLDYSSDGLAALRMWGQTGDRPTVWIAAADPVYLEARLDHLCLHALRGDNMPGEDLGELIDYLQERLAGQQRYGFARIGSCAYVRADRAMQTSDYPAYLIDQQLPNEFMPKNDETGTYHALRGEVEMALHDHAVNLRRAGEGMAPINSLWLWGGGFAPQQETLPQPPLFSDDPMLKGYWYSKTGVVAGWPGNIDECLQASVAGFVAQPSISDADSTQQTLNELKAALKSGRISQLTLLFGGRTQVRLRSSDTWKIWRRSPELFGPSS